MKVRLLACVLGSLLALGVPFAALGGPTTPTTDADADGIPDIFDNCTGLANAGQADTDHDGCGDACSSPSDCVSDDGLGNPTGPPDGVVDIFDLQRTITDFNAHCDQADPLFNPLDDCTCDRVSDDGLGNPTGPPDDVVDIFDLQRLISDFNVAMGLGPVGPPGPALGSGITNTSVDCALCTTNTAVTSVCP